MKNFNQSTAQELLDNYNTKSRSNPKFSRLGDGGITITLPEKDSWEWANRAAGDSGGESARPVGIRILPSVVKKVWGDQDKAISSIFNSATSLKQTIEKYGDGTGADHLARKLVNKAVHASNLQKSDIMKKAMIDALIDMAIELEESLGK